MRRAIRETDLKKVADRILLEEAKGDPYETLTEAEFLISVLEQQELVDKQTIHAIRSQFFHLTNKRAWKATDQRYLDSKLVFLEMVEQRRVRDRPNTLVADSMPFGAAIDRMVRLGRTRPGDENVRYDADGLEVQLVERDCPDGGYHEWLHEHWMRMVREANGGVLKQKASPLAKLTGGELCVSPRAPPKSVAKELI